MSIRRRLRCGPNVDIVTGTDLTDPAEARKLLALATPCGICMEPIGLGLCCDPIKSSRKESWSKDGCRCMFCRECYGTYIETKINEHRVNHIPCPTPGCSALLLEPEVQAAVPPALFARYKELRSVDHKQRLDLRSTSGAMTSVRALGTL